MRGFHLSLENLEPVVEMAFGFSRAPSYLEEERPPTTFYIEVAIRVRRKCDEDLGFVGVRGGRAMIQR